MPIPRGALDALRVVSLLDCLYLVGLLYAATQGREEAVAILGPTHGLLYLLLMLTLAWAANQGWWGWRFVVAVAIFGPLASVPGLERVRMVQRRRTGQRADEPGAGA